MMGHSNLGGDLNKETGSKSFSSSIDLEEKPGLDCVKVIIVTIACCNRMQDIAGIWDQLRDYLVSKFDELNDSPNSDDILICLNIHNEGQKVPISPEEETNPQLWE